MAYIIKKGMTREEMEQVFEAAGVGKAEKDGPDWTPYTGILKGKILIDEDPVEIQRRLRREWDRS